MAPVPRIPARLGRYRSGGCSCPDCRMGDGGTRWRKRVERREVRVVIEEDSPRPLIFDEHDLAVIGMYEDGDGNREPA